MKCPAGGVSVLDMRRLDRDASKMLLATCWLPRTSRSRSQSNAPPSFDAEGGSLVAAVAREQMAYRWCTHRQAAEDGDDPQLDGLGTQEGLSSSPSTPTTPRPARETKPKRQPSGAKGRNNGAPGGGRRKQ